MFLNNISHIVINKKWNWIANQSNKFPFFFSPIQLKNCFEKRFGKMIVNFFSLRFSVDVDVQMQCQVVNRLQSKWLIGIHLGFTKKKTFKRLFTDNLHKWNLSISQSFFFNGIPARIHLRFNRSTWFCLQRNSDREDYNFCCIYRRVGACDATNKSMSIITEC